MRNHGDERPAKTAYLGAACRAPPTTSGTLTEFMSPVQTGRQPESSGRDKLGSIVVMEAAAETATRRHPVAISGTEEAVDI